jgi:hypothetical protein
MPGRCVFSFIFRVVHFQEQLSQFIDVTRVQYADVFEGLDADLFSPAGHHDCRTEVMWPAVGN